MNFPTYSFEATILVLDLYLRNRDGSVLQVKDVKVITLSGILKEICHKNYPKRKLSEACRSPASVVYKLTIFKRLDENKKYSHSKPDAELWREYKNKPLSEINAEAKRIKDDYGIGGELIGLDCKDTL